MIQVSVKRKTNITIIILTFVIKKFVEIEINTEACISICQEKSRS